MLPMFLAAIFIIILVLAKVSDFGKMAAHRIRYLSFFTPTFIAAVIISLYCLIKAALKKERAAVIITAIFAAVCGVFVNFTDFEFITGSKNIPYSDIAQMLDGQTVIASTFPVFNMQYTPEILRKTDKVWFDSPNKFFANSDEYIQQIKEKDQFYVMLYTCMMTYEKDMDNFKEKYPLFFKPEHTKEDLKNFNVQFVDDYIGFFENMDFVDDIQFDFQTKINGFDAMFFKVTTKNH